MATTTPNFGWPVPTSTDLVKDGATAIEALGDAIDASLVDLEGGTTGQILAKASNADMDFAWITNDVGDITAVTAGTGISGGGTSGAVTITNSMATAIDAKGDLIAGTGADAFSRLAVGTNGQVLTADSTASTGLAWANASVADSLGYTAGKNKLVNADFTINQRSFTSITTNGYGFDRWAQEFSGACTYSAQTFTAGTAPVAGYEGTNFARLAASSQSASGNYAILEQRIEDVRTYANQTVTLSFWAKASSGTPKVGTTLQQNFGSGGSSFVLTKSGDVTISTSWARYSVTATVPSIAGKTIGTSSYLRVLLFVSAGSGLATYTDIGLQNATIDFWGVQLEAGSIMTAFQTASATIQGELAIAQRYYQRVTGNASNTAYIIFGIAASSTRVFMSYAAPVVFRSTPSVTQSTVSIGNTVISNQAITSISNYSNGGLTQISLDIGVASGLTAGSAYFMAMPLNGYLELSAEL